MGAESPIADRKWIIVHSSDELYGADRVLLEAVRAFGIDNIKQCWLPTDVVYTGHELCAALDSRGVTSEHCEYPVLRREYMNPKGVLLLAKRLLMARRRIRTLATSNCNAVYLTTSATIMLAPYFKHQGLFVVLHVHETWSHNEARLFKWMLPYIDRVIAVSKDVASRVPGDVRVVYNGFLDSEWGERIPSDRSVGLRFLMASRWSTWKGHRELLSAWRLARLNGAQLTILGGPPPSGKATDVAGLVQELGLSESVDVVGETKNVDWYLQRCDVVLVPSVQPDPLPTIAIEAARAGRAVVASDSGGLPEIVEHGRTGWLVEPANVSKWAQCLSSISALESSDRGRAARDLYLERFSSSRFVSDFRAAVV
jgi:glycosyltransferase involved in cell wall biosynthesis